MRIFGVISFLLTGILTGQIAWGFHPRCAWRRATLPSSRTSLLMSVPNPLDTLTSGLVSIFRLPGGVTVADGAALYANEEEFKIKQLYDVENSPACRKVRERITELDLVVDLVIPSAANSRVFTDSNYKFALPSGTLIPRLVLVDSGKEISLSGVDEILTFLDGKYSISTNLADDDVKGQVITVLREVGNYLATAVRVGRGSKVSPAAGPGAARPVKPLVLYSYEGNQFCRLVREVLTELDLVYELRSAGKQSPRRSELAEITGGSTQCPYLLDPNNDVAMSESADIIRYLYETYALWTPPNEILQWASEVILPTAKPLFAVLAPLQAGAKREDSAAYQQEIIDAKSQIEQDAQKNPVVIYTYGLSPFSFETKALLDSLNITYLEISLGLEWFPGFIAEGGSQKRAALLEMTGQSSLPHIFIGGKSIGGLFSGTPGLVPALEQGILMDMIRDATKRAEMAPSTTGS